VTDDTTCHTAHFATELAPARHVRGFAIGLGLTNECSLACSICYRDPARVDRPSTLNLPVYALVLTSDWIGERLRLRVA
jgi:MoaA/NifB/PqqE/SkfB family radical SAM enzyme